MGIKGYTTATCIGLSALTECRIYGEIGPGERIALSKLAIEHFEKHGRPVRIAIDASIWQFQTQAGKGGSNPAVRTLYYRLLRLLSLSIRPIFIFDGPNKPPFKRNVKTAPHGASLPNFITKQLLQLFGFPYHTAPGEAEAECALLQKEGIVDAVFSEDVDTMMFGCTVQLRNWSSENTRGNKVPTHVNLYRAEATKQGKSGLDSDGMILIALMSGGDYIPAGVPKCGIKIACEAARAGFGRDLCRLDKKDTVGFNQWRERLQYELHVNESGFFRSRHKALTIPDTFPDKKVLGYYIRPAVSTAAQLLRLREEIKWDGSLDLLGLRQFVAEAFEWKNFSGAKKFVRGLAPAMLIDRLCNRYNMDLTDNDLVAQEIEEKNLITAICSRRNHFTTDAVPELRIAYTPIDIVGLDLAAEEPDIEVLEVSDSEIEVREGEDPGARSRSPTKRAPSIYDPTQPEKIWVLESYVKFGVPLMVENWEEDLRNPKKFATRKARERTALSKKSEKPDETKPGAMDAYVKIMKPGIDRRKPQKDPEPPPSLVPSTTAASAPLAEGSPTKKRAKEPQAIQQHPPSTSRKPALPKQSTPATRTTPSPRDNSVNPWTLSRRPSDTLNAKLPPSTRYSALGIYEPSTPKTCSSLPTQPIVDNHQKSQQLPTPISSGARRRRRASESTQPVFSRSSDSRRVNRKLSFTGHSSIATQSGPATPESLPSPSMLTSPPDRVLVATKPVCPISCNEPGQDVKRTRALLALRESLDGAWRDIEPWERSRPYIKSVFDGVNVIDLTKT
ncbi:MAG: hypothetical protein Q9181_006399 [Wetmoreana brouardii]